MAKKIGPLLYLFGGAAVSLACGCRWFETEAQLQQLYEQSDAVFTGQAIAAIGPRTPGLNRRFLGDDVRLRVIAWKKGLVRRDTLVVLQAEGNCNRAFVVGDTVYVFARTIRRVLALPRHDTEHRYSYVDEEKQFFYKDGPTAVVKHYRAWARRYPVVTTNQCPSFTKQHQLVPAFFQAKKDH